MVNTVKSVLRSLKRSPLKSFLTLFTVGLGVGVLIFALSMSQTFTLIMKSELEDSGIIVNVANATYTEGEGIDIVRPPSFDDKIFTALKTEIEGVQGVTPIGNVFWNTFIANQKTYRFRTIIGADEDYLAISGMNIIAGSFFTAEDVEKGTKSMIISESIATQLFGSPQEALGKTIKPPAQTGNNQRGRRRMTPPTYTITGVFTDLAELKRKAYGLSDAVVPITSVFPANMNNQMAQRFFMSRLSMLVKGQDLNSIESQVRAIVARTYGDLTDVHVWEGTPNGRGNVLEDTRNSITSFATIVNLLGFLLLITGSIGILSIMVVEVLGRTRDISLERALGAAKIIIIKEYFIRSVIMTTASVLLGIILSIVFAGPLREIILPIFGMLGDVTFTGSIITPLAICISGAAALFIGGIFGTMPVFSTLQTGISEGLREV